MWRCVRIVQDQLLADGTTFVARFDKSAVADAALGCPLPIVPSEVMIPLAAKGKAGKGLPLDTAVIYNARHNIPVGRSRMAFDLTCDATSGGTLLSLSGLTIQLGQGKLRVRQGQEKPLEAMLKLPAAAARHRFTISWSESDLKVACDGQEVLAVRLQSPLIPPLKRGIQIRGHGKSTDGPFTIGPVRDAMISNLEIGGPFEPK